MKYQSTFKRFELKYIITSAQKEKVLEATAPLMQPDQYGETTICNIYLDTDNYRLIRRSLEKPVYKEKLRIRSYGTPKSSDRVFVELKKKYKSVVYKRRLSLREEDVMKALLENIPLPESSQIADEIEYFRRHYAPLSPKVFLCYDRQAYYDSAGGDLRITFDRNIRYRTSDLSLTSPPGGQDILPPGMHLMEIKTAGAMPLWLARALSENKIFKTSFSKYGTAYTYMQRSL